MCQLEPLIERWEYLTEPSGFPHNERACTQKSVTAPKTTLLAQNNVHDHELPRKNCHLQLVLIDSIYLVCQLLKLFFQLLQPISTLQKIIRKA